MIARIGALTLVFALLPLDQAAMAAALVLVLATAGDVSATRIELVREQLAREIHTSEAVGAPRGVGSRE